MSRPIQSIPARNLQPGDIVRLTDDRDGQVVSLEFAENNLIVGGELNKTATALRVTLVDGKTFLIHPGQLIGLRWPQRAVKKRGAWVFRR